MSAYRFILSILAIVITAFLWIALDYSMGLITTALNSAATVSEVIATNNMIDSIFYFVLFIEVVAIVIYNFKPTTDQEEQDDYATPPAF